VVQFHPLAPRGIGQLAHRQFNEATVMALPTQLARWPHKQLPTQPAVRQPVGPPVREA